jgi:hypothetical protein
MDQSELIKRGKGLLGDLTAVIEKLSDEEIRMLFDSGEIEAFLRAVLDPATEAAGSSLHLTGSSWKACRHGTPTTRRIRGPAIRRRGA